jgi:hypothetical protein
MQEDRKISGNQGAKTKIVCAINEQELNKVELAYFKRPPSTAAVILSDK